MSEDSLLERVTAAAEERQALPSDRAGEFYEEATRGFGAGKPISGHP